MDDCQKVNGESGHESNPCDGAMIGDGSTQLIIDFAFFGRMHYDTAVPGCYQPDVPPPEDSAGCMAPVSETILRYWCQGKDICRPQSTVIVNYSPNSCEDVTGMLHLRTRKVPPGNVSSCALGSHYYEPHRTCYQMTDQAGDWEDQLLLCRRLGGDLAFVPAGNQTDFLAFLSRLSSGQPLWVAGSASEARPVVDLRRAWYLSGVGSCVGAGGGGGGPVDTCEQALLRAACALPPWPAAAVPISVQCPPVSFPSLVGGVTFVGTEAGHTAAVPCGAGYSGDATYTCDVDGQWSAAYPDLTACTSDGIDTDAVAKSLRDGDQPVSDVVDQLATNCSAVRQLSAGDVVSSAQLLPLMVATQRLQLETLPDGAHVAETYLSNFTRLVSILTATDSSWLTMSLLKKRSSSSLIQHNVEQSAYLLAGLLHNVSMVFDKYQQQIRLQVGRFTAGPLLQHLQYSTGGGSVTLPGEVAQFADVGGSTSVVFVEYVTMDCLLGSRPCRAFHDSDEPYKGFINSPLLSASVANTSVQLLNSNVTLVFNRRLVNSSSAKYDTSNTQCVFWDNDPDVQYWSSDGCYVIATTEDTVVCNCSHLTSFATLLDFNGVVSPGLDAALDWITKIGCGVSLACLAVCVLVFTAIPALRSDRTSVHRNLCLCLFTAELIMLAGLTPHGNAVGCAIVAGLLHYFFLAVFAWMCIEGVQIYLLLYKVFDSGRSYMRYFYVFGYGIPAVIVGISVAVDSDGYGETGPRGISSGACWLNSANLIWAFAGPALVVILVNILALILALRVTQRARAARSDKSTGQAATWLKGSASLVAILGTTWLFGFMYFSKGTVFIAVIFTILNSLQGVFIFLFHVILNDKTKREATRFMRKTTVRMGLTAERTATTTPGSGGRPAHTTQTRLGATSSSPLASTSADDAGPSQSKPLGRLQQLARRMGNAHYSVKRVDGKSMSSDGTSSHETLRKVDSSASDNHATA